MANDIDLWQDIEALEKLGKQKEADSLLKIFSFRYNGEGTEKDLEKAKDNHFKKYGYSPNI